jgi:polyketide cyclase/dehydrase/lipid transport protein
MADARTRNDLRRRASAALLAAALLGLAAGPLRSQDPPATAAGSAERHQVRVSKKTTVEAPADAVWEIVGDFNGLGKMLDAVAKSTLTGTGVGAVRLMILQDGREVEERLESFDPQARTLTYRALRTPLAVNDYVSTMTVRELGPSLSEFEWSSTFEPAGISDDEARKLVEGFYLAAFEGLKKRLAPPARPQ